jgi:hypothetical protein
MPLRRGATGCPRAMTRLSYYESQISSIQDVLSTSRDNCLVAAAGVEQSVKPPTSPIAGEMA